MTNKPTKPAKRKVKVSDEDGQILDRLKEGHPSLTEKQINSRALRFYDYYYRKKLNNPDAEVFISENGQQTRVELLF